jgi:putative alpha-1,2-mannosidase
MENGHVLEVKAPGVSDTNRYVKAVKLNGKPLGRLYLTHEELSQGGTLEFTMGRTPNKRRGTSADTKPYSL